MKKISTALCSAIQQVRTTLAFAMFMMVVAVYPGQAQDVLDDPIDLNLDGPHAVSLKEALMLIQQHADVQFVYSDNLISAGKEVTLYAGQKKELRDVLTRLLIPLNLQYKVIANQIIIEPRPASQKSQRGPVQGTVTDSETGQPLPGVNVVVKGANIGTMTDSEGHYNLNVPSESFTLIFSFIGYETAERLVTGETILDVRLAVAVRRLEDVVVIGYGTQNRRDLTGAISTITGKDIKSVVVSSFDQALQGRAPGVVVTQNSASPGGGISVRIRGGNSIQGGSEPLYVIDGFPVYNDNTRSLPRIANTTVGLPPNALASLSPNDIESIEVLKDASATAIYGSRGANGVVLITTKRGKAGVNQVSFDSYYGIQQVRKKIDMMNAQEYVEFVNEAARNESRPEPFTDPPASYGKGTDWQDEVFRDAPVQSHQLTFNGGDENTQFSITGSIFRQEGVIINSDFTRGAFRVNLDRKINNNLKIGSSLSITRTINNAVFTENEGTTTAGVTHAALTIAPVLAVKDEFGNYVNSTALDPLFPNKRADNPVATARDILNRLGITRFLGVFFVENSIGKHVTLRVSGGSDISNTLRDLYYKRTTERGRLLNRPAGKGNIEQISWLNENTITYERTFGKHQVTALGGFTMQAQTLSYNSFQSRGFTNDILLNENMGAGPAINQYQSSKVKWSLLSYIARVNYVLSEKYLFTITNRVDGSSKFGADNKYGMFPSGAVGWRISDEPFLEGTSWLSDLKIRSSYGLTGNQEIGEYQSLARYANSRYFFGNNVVAGIGPDLNAKVANPDLRWERTSQFDVGLDLGLLNDRISLSADYYHKVTRDLLTDITLPTTSGYQTALVNKGSLENKGIELGLSTVNIDRALRWTTQANFASNRNNVLDLGEVTEFLGGVEAGASDLTSIIRVGEPIGTFFGYIHDGIFQNIEEVSAHAQQSAPPKSVGEIRLKDLDNDGVVDGDDRTIIGRALPKFTAGLTNTVSYKGLELNVFLYAVYGNDIFNANLIEWESARQRNNQTKNVLNRWKSEGTNTLIPKAAISPSRSRFMSSMVEDGSFLRVRNITLAYNLPLRWLESVHLRNARVYISGQNLFTFTNYSWYDPEVSSFQQSYYANSNLSVGIDFESYPQSKSYMAGINLTF